MIHKLALWKHHAACLSQIMVDIDIRLPNININLDRGQTDKKIKTQQKRRTFFYVRISIFHEKLTFFGSLLALFRFKPSKERN